MTRLADVSADDLQGALETVEDKRPTIRLIAAIAVADGTSQTTVADWLGVERKTVYNWLVRFEENPGRLATAARDGARTGRPSKLSASQHETLTATLGDPPTSAGVDAAEWTPELVRRHVLEAFGVEYSIESCRRLLRDVVDG